MDVARVTQWALLLSLGSSGCGDDGDDFDPAICGEPLPGQPSVTIGGADNGFRAITEGQDFAVNVGAQGGTHLDMHAKATGIVAGTQPELVGDPCNPEVLFTVFDSVGNALHADLPPKSIGFVATGDEFHLPGPRAFVLLDASQEELDSVYGNNLRLVVDVVDARGTAVSDEIVVVAIENDLTNELLSF